MPLTLGNDLTGLVAREVESATRTTTGLGKSLTTGDNAFVEVVDGFLGNALRDGEIILGALAKNTSYSINLLTITDEYLSSIASSLQDGLATIGTSSTVSVDKLAVLQKNLDDKKAQADLLIRTAKFDGKNLLGGGAKSIDVQVGLNVTDKLNISISDIGTGKLFRSTITNALNVLLAGGQASTRYANAAERAAGTLNNDNFIRFAMANAGGSGTGGAITAQQFGDAVFALTADQKALLIQVAPTTATWLSGNGAAASFSDATANQIRDAVTNGGALANGAGNAAQQANFVELYALFNDNAATLITGATDAARTTNRARAQDVLQGALTTIRGTQANVSNQKTNVVESADALKASTNVTQQAADSYLKTDYVLTAQQYSEEIRKIVASITSLQAANKIPEAAQRLIDALAR